MLQGREFTSSVTDDINFYQIALLFKVVSWTTDKYSFYVSSLMKKKDGKKIIIIEKHIFFGN